MFIDYLRNSSSRPFLKLLAVFYRKEYQYKSGNITPIHLLGKNCQLSEHSRTEVFDLIRNNIVYIIKPEEVDDLIKEGNINKKAGVIQMQPDELIYLIHTWNS